MTSAKCEPAQIEQGSEAWHEWRSKGIGASVLPAIMVESEYDTPRSLWRRLTGRDPEQDRNYAMTIGLDNEAKARALYELETGVDCPPALFQHPDLEWARCSLDGWVEDLARVVEFKCMGREKHAMVRGGKVPETYVGQLQWQLFVTGARVAHFVSLNPEGMSDIEIVPVTVDPEYWKRMIPAAKQFWSYIQTDTPPPLTDRDYMEEVDDETLEALRSWYAAKRMIAQLEVGSTKHTDDVLRAIQENLKEEKANLETARQAIHTAMKHPKLRAAGVKVITKKTGTLDIRLDEKVTT